ncbi:MAG: hypothetical protein AAB610_03375 [Patescibacteria group bacterium]
MAKKLKWTLEKIKEGFKAFYDQHGHYPTSHEVDAYAKLPSSRQIQRTFGGLPALRKQLGFGDEDFTKGEYSSNRARIIGQRAHKVEKEVYGYLIKIFGVEFVHREYFFNDDKRNRTDFYVYHKAGTFSVDVFYPKNLRIVNGCINSKLKTYIGLEIKYPTIFLMMNDSITDAQIGNLMRKKKNKLKAHQSVMTMGEFKAFCSSVKKKA